MPERPEKLDKVHLIICVTAAAAVTLGCIIQRVSLFDMALWVSVAIMIFFVLGQVARHYLATRVFPLPVAEDGVVEDLEAIDTAEEAMANPVGGDDPLGYVMTEEPTPMPAAAGSRPDFAPVMDE